MRLLNNYDKKIVNLKSDFFNEKSKPIFRNEIIIQNRCASFKSNDLNLKIERKLNKIVEITEWIENHSTEIIRNIDQESIDVYNFLKKEFNESNIIENYLFQFVFRSFYRIDNAGLTPEFKKEYFEILEHNRNENQFDFEKVLR